VDEFLEQFLVTHRQIRIILLDIYTGINQVPTLVMNGTDQIGVFDNAGEGHRRIADI
jgi:hypothetical protein